MRFCFYFDHCFELESCALLGAFESPTARTDAEPSEGGVFEETESSDGWVDVLFRSE